MIDMKLLASYEKGPRIWDAAAIHPQVMELADAGLIEPVTGSSAWKITQAGLDALEAYDELGPTVRPLAQPLAQSMAGGPLAEISQRMTALADELREQGHDVVWDGQTMIVQVRTGKEDHDG